MNVRMSRRGFLKGASVGAALLAAGGPTKLLAYERRESVEANKANCYKHRLAFGAWMNDPRNEPLPLQNWPAHQFDDETVDSLIRTMDVQQEAGYNWFDVFGLFATSNYPPDIVSVLDDDRRKKVKKVFKAAKERDIKLMFGLGLMTWGFDKILEADPEVHSYSDLYPGTRHSHAMCGAKEKSWQYVNKILDFAFSEFPFDGVHMESADQGWCHCPECGGKYGVVGYNARLNIRCADYIRSKWSHVMIMTIPLNWLALALQQEKRGRLNEQEKSEIIELSKHIDCFMDQGHSGNYVQESERQDFIKRLHCDYGTSGGVWLYPSVRWDRSSYFLPYVKRTCSAIKKLYEDGGRACLYYQGPVANPGTEVVIAAGGRILSDATRKPEDILSDVIDVYYKPKTSAAQQKLVSIFLRAEDAYFDQWEGMQERFRAAFDVAPDWEPHEFPLDGLWGDSPGPAAYLQNPRLSAEGRQNYKKGLIAVLEDLQQIEDEFDDGGRLAKIKRGMIITLTLINSIS